MNETGKRIPSLDGLRAVSIGMVVLSHLTGTQGFPIPTWVPVVHQLGDLGVRVFFVISGFLITGILLHERAATERIDLVRFYLRRTFRIFPPYYAFLLVVIALDAYGWLQLAPKDAVHALTYTSNYYADRSWYVGHTWSLSVEEQFYLLWPAVLLVAGTRRGLIAAAVLIVVCPFVRLAEWQLFGASLPNIGHSFETVADSLAVGCVLAGSGEWLRRQALYERVMDSKLCALAPLAVLATTLLSDRPRLSFFFGYTIMNLGVAVCVEWCVRHHEGRIGRALNWTPVVFVGAMSYSIYLWQQLFIDRESTSVVASFPLNVVLAVLAALASYFVVERPALALRRRLERPRRLREEAAEHAERRGIRGQGHSSA